MPLIFFGTQNGEVLYEACKVVRDVGIRANA